MRLQGAIPTGPVRYRPSYLAHFRFLIVCFSALGTSLGSSFDDSSAALEKLISPHHLSPTASSPFGPLSDQHSRRTFISLIQVLNASFPDYDFRHACYATLHL